MNDEAPTRGDVDRLIHTITDLQAELRLHRHVVERSDRRSRSAQFLSVMSILLMAIAFYVAYQSSRAVLTFEALRDEGRLTDCIRDNVNTVAYREASAQSLLVLAIDPDHLTASEEALAAAYRASLEARLPFRDCSPEGIRRYYENLPDDPGR